MKRPVEGVELPRGTARKPPAPPGNPFAGAKLWVDPDSAARKLVTQWASSRDPSLVAKATVMERIASQPVARWFGDWDPSITVAVDRYVTRATAAGCLPLLALYAIPGRDAGHDSAGGAADAAAYRAWIAGVATGIGGRKAVVILEPDALALNLPSKGLVGEAVRLLAAPQTHTYLDAGDVGWWPPATMADRLSRAHVAEAAGFVLNVSHFSITSECLTYGAAISAKLGGAHFVVDTSRNSDETAWSVTNPEPEGRAGWCNARAKSGLRPLTAPGSPLCDAFCWIKTPGVSDGTYNPLTGKETAPKAGTWWTEYALALAS